VPGATAVRSTATDAWRQRKGVCQGVAPLCGVFAGAGTTSHVVQVEITQEL